MPKYAVDRDIVLNQVIKKLRHEGCKDLHSILPGHTHPKPIRGIKSEHTPDLTCKKDDPNKTQIVVSVETSETILSDSRSERWMLLVDFCQKTSSEFYIAVPPMCKLPDGRVLQGRDVILSRLRELNLSTEGIKIWVIDVTLEDTVDGSQSS